MCFKFTFPALSLSCEFEQGESSSTYFPLAVGHRYSSSSSRFTQSLVSPPSSQVYHSCIWHDCKIKFPAVEVKRSTAQLPLSKGSILAFGKEAVKVKLAVNILTASRVICAQPSDGAQALPTYPQV